MSNEVFPNLLTLTWDRVKKPTWNTLIKTAASGKEYRSALWSYPVWNFTLSYDLLSNSEGLISDFQKIISFFNARRGAYEDFLFEDVTDNHGEAVCIGIGDGINRQFQLLRKLGGWVEPVKNLKGSPLLYVDGVKQESGFTVNQSGLVTFKFAPAENVEITATFDFYYRVRFAQDEAEFNQFLYNLYELKQLELKGVK